MNKILIFIKSLIYTVLVFFASLFFLNILKYKKILLDSIISGELKFELLFHDFKLVKLTFIISVFICIIIFYFLNIDKNFKYGKEYGSSRWAKKGEIKKYKDKNENHKILGDNVFLSFDGKKTKLNNNTLWIGGSGAGKSLFAVTPNILHAKTSFVILDAKGELYENTHKYLEKKGYKIKVLNLKNLDKSNKYNPFKYIVKSTDLAVLSDNIVNMGSKKNEKDSVWNNLSSIFLLSLIYYVYYYEDYYPKNLNTVVYYKNSLTHTEEYNESEIYKKMDYLLQNDKDNIASNLFFQAIHGASETVSSIVSNTNAMMKFFGVEDVVNLFSDDELELEKLGEEKTALYLIIPDDDQTFNFIITILYRQLFTILYKIADEKYGGRLPIGVEFYLDEFANVSVPDNFLNIIATCRSRNIGLDVIIQNISQLKKMYERDTWEIIPGNCDSIVYLGSNELSAHKYVKELLGKQTINKKSSSISRGRMGGSSQSVDILGRDLMTVDEIKKLSTKKEIIFIKGEYPILAKKYKTFKKREYKQATKLSKE